MQLVIQETVDAMTEGGEVYTAVDDMFSMIKRWSDLILSLFEPGPAPPEDTGPEKDPDFKGANADQAGTEDDTSGTTGGTTDDTDFDHEYNQLGGPALPNKPTLLGEVGPELWVPQTAGSFVSYSDLVGALTGRTTSGGGAANVSLESVSITIQGAADPQATALATRRELEKLINEIARDQRSRGRSWRA